MANETLAQELTTLLESKGATLVGFADLRSVSPDIRSNFSTGISIAVALNPRIISEIQEGPTKEYHGEYERANSLLNSLGSTAERFLKEKGYVAKSFSATTTDAGYNPETLSTILPHKTIATRAGIGWIGKCALLVNRTFGSAIRLTSVMTNAGLPAGDAIDVSQCGDCSLCVDNCPGKAPSGRNWQVSLYRDSFFDPFACRKAARELALRNTGLQVTICGICIAVCPWTQNYIKRSS